MLDSEGKQETPKNQHNIMTILMSNRMSTYRQSDNQSLRKREITATATAAADVSAWRQVPAANTGGRQLVCVHELHHCGHRMKLLQ